MNDLGPTMRRTCGPRCFGLYDKTNFEPLFDAPSTASGTLMESFPDGWGPRPTAMRRTLPHVAAAGLADPRGGHPRTSEWLRQIKHYVLAAQHASGAIRQRVIHETTANDQYGTGECALIQANGDPACDLLYATNFAFIGLHEAAAATGDPELKQAEDRLADFLVRIQIRSESHRNSMAPGIAASTSRSGITGARTATWLGVWCIETGWTQAWITTTLGSAAHEYVALGPDRGQWHRRVQEASPGMLPDEVLKDERAVDAAHGEACRGGPAGPPGRAAAPGLLSGGSAALTDGKLPAEASSAAVVRVSSAPMAAPSSICEGQRRFAVSPPTSSQDTSGGIDPPKQVEFAVSEDGQTFQSVATVKHSVSLTEAGPLTRELRADGLNVRRALRAPVGGQPGPHSRPATTPPGRRHGCLWMN